MTDRSRRRPWLAAALALVVSGLGHAYLRRWARALGWYVAVTATLVLIVPDAAVERLIAGDRPPIADIAPAVFVVAASVIDAYVLALRINREDERERRTEGSEPADSAASEPADSTASTGQANVAATTDGPVGSVADDAADTEAVQCPNCGKKTDAAFDFCQWCAEPVDD